MIDAGYSVATHGLDGQRVAVELVSTSARIS